MTFLHKCLGSLACLFALLPAAAAQSFSPVSGPVCPIYTMADPGTGCTYTWGKDANGCSVTTGKICEAPAMCPILLLPEAPKGCMHTYKKNRDGCQVYTGLLCLSRWSTPLFRRLNVR